MVKGVIYRLTSPSGEKYIGQTVTTAYKRWRDHNYNSGRKEHGCVVLYRAIRKYGFENFTKEVILECEDYELDFYEITYIMEENTLVPNGYNILPGGRCKIDELPIEYQQFYSQNVRKHVNYDLPPGVAEICLPQRGKYGEYGFKVYVGEKTHDFISNHESMDMKLQQALECYEIVKAGGEYHRLNHHKWDKDILNWLRLIFII